ncbi:MAG: amidohydrolase family protein, partial [Selenomonadaceae bacterium]|nr:amidohydrolase family protein [Selenomonadaceae bacterium]
MDKNFVIQGVKLLNHSGEVVTANIFVSDDKISKISADEPKNIKIIDGKGKFATPGLVNAHTHASMTILRSFSDDKSLMDWLQKDIWPIEDKMTRQDIYFGAKLAAVEMI